MKTNATTSDIGSQTGSIVWLRFIASTGQDPSSIMSYLRWQTKKKALNGYFDQTKDNNISLKYTGRCGAEALIWCRDKLLEFENEVFLSETFETKIVVYGEDHRRFRFYERALTRYGYEKKLTDDGWAMVKRVRRSNYDAEVS